MDARFVWLVIALIALMATLSATELVRVCAHRLHAVDRPGGRRLHHTPTARLGGLGIFWGFALALAAAAIVPMLEFGPDAAGAPHAVGLVFAGALLLGVGWIDDVRDLRPTTKLLFQMTAAVLLFATGWRVESLGLPGVVTIPLGVMALPVTVGWVVVVTNAMNLIDGLDGLAVGLGVVAVLFAVGITPAAGGTAALTAALAGALLGFLWFNMHPAMIFMGDAGSLFVGVMVAALTMHAGAGTAGAFPLVPMLLVAVPLADTAAAILRRSGGIPVSLAAWRSLPRRVFTPDSLHFHHRLRRAGLSVRQAAGALWLAAIAFALCAQAFALSTAAGWGAIACTLVAAGVAYRRLARAAGTGAATSSSVEPVPILFVINDLILGGAQRVLLDQARALDGGRFRIEVASLEIDPGGPVGEALERHGIRVHRLRRRGEPLILALPRLALRMLALRPELVHTHLAAAGVGGRIVARALGVRVVVSTQHNLSDWEERRGGWLRRADRATLFLADRIVTVSDAVRGAMAAVLPALGARGVTVHHGIDPDRFRRPPGARAEAREALGLASDVMTVVAVARLDPRKGIDVLLDGLAQLPPGHAWVLCVVGDGPERRALEARARTLGIADAVRFEGAQEDVRPWLWAADLCAVPSRTEGLGVVVIEALASGTPVFASPVGGIPELLGAGRGGRLVAGVHAEAWMEALAPVFSSPATLAPLAAAAPEHAAAFSLERAAVALAGVYERCLARSGVAVAPARPLALRQGVPAFVPVPAFTAEELERAA